eukprot:TRINITY_DN69064_c0_g1_i1.p1 TRINITY_DN69064_c0_g1~~TRINITY_DN69064_c0_g1_i1.p1  ORF type:complete len:349 (-),score=44.51 TRINITY_DN69064_c0_g1_i1:88-1134(-)
MTDSRRSRFNWWLRRRNRCGNCVDVIRPQECATTRPRVRSETWDSWVEVARAPSKVIFPNAVFWLRMLFGRKRSRWFGYFSRIRIPLMIRTLFFRIFAFLFGSDLGELKSPLSDFATLSDFFSRELRDGSRPIAKMPLGIVSPADAKVLTFGMIDSANARVEQVKGTTYSANTFLGGDPFPQAEARGVAVHYVVLYLDPGKYHRVHSPCDVRLDQGLHFSGEFFPLRSILMENMNDLFCLNERVVLSGNWRWGRMHLAAIAAANVGDIYLDFDPNLKTNQDAAVFGTREVFSKMYPEGVNLNAGSMFGGFKFGSSVVLVFEAPRDFKWHVSSGSIVKVGEPLGEAEDR